MQPRMERYGTTEDISWSILLECENGMLSTVNGDGSPYTVPMNYLCLDGRIYIHGRRAGTKLDNIKRDLRVCFAVFIQDGYEYGSDHACDTETIFRSAVVMGTARVVDDPIEKARILRALADRFGMEDRVIPEKSIVATCVVEITPEKVTGKVHPPSHSG